MITGTVMWFDDYRGFGFLTPDDGGRSVFVHITAAQKAGLTLHEGDRVSYDVIEDKRSHKPQANNLKPVE